MRMTIVLLGASCALLIGGCGQGTGDRGAGIAARDSADETRATRDEKREPAVEVTVADNGKFPEFLAGTWLADTNDWEFVFERDGTISSARIDSGFISVVPSKGIATKPLARGGKAIYKLGKWRVQYEPKSRELAVEVVVEHYHFDMKPNWLEGSQDDWFVGPVSEDGQTWEATWSSYPKNIACTPDCNQLATPDESELTRDLVFNKVKPKAAK